MKACPNCGQPNPEEDRFCVNCGIDMLNIPAPGAVPPVGNNPNYAATYPYNPYNRSNQSILDNGLVRFVLYAECVLVPIVGLVLALILSITPFQGQKELSAKLIRCAAIATIVWCVIAFFYGFIVGLASALA